MGLRVKKILPSLNRFIFADSVYDSLGKVSIPLLKSPANHTVIVGMYVLNTDIPAPLCLGVLGKEFLTPCTVFNRLIKRVATKDIGGSVNYTDEWSVPSRRSKGGHLYA